MKSKILLFIFALMFAKEISAQNYNFCALDMLGSDETLKKWTELNNYLSKNTGYQFKLTTIKMTGMVNRSEGFDLILLNPVVAIKIENKKTHEIIATLNDNKEGAKLAGVIIVPLNSQIKNLSDLAGKKVGVVNLKSAAGGFLFQAYELVKAGLDPKKDFKNFIEIPNQKAIIARVIEQQIDAGFIRSGMLEEAKGTSDISRVRIVNRMDTGLDYPRSTDVYPNWAVLISKKISQNDKKKIQNALFALTPKDKACIDGDMKGFIPPANYDKILLVMQKLKVM